MGYYSIKLKKFIEIVIMQLLVLVLLVAVGQNVYATNDIINLVYFSSPTCGNCAEVNTLLQESKYDNINIIKYDISDLKNKSLLNEYCEKYKVDNQRKGMVPVVIIREQFLYGLYEIKEKLDTTINSNFDINTTLIEQSEKNSSKFRNETIIFDSLSILKVFLLALLNGLNPCSISMVLFLVMLLGSKIKIIKKVSIGFCIGKVLTFVLLGSVCFQFLNQFSSNVIFRTLNVFFIFIFLYLAIINLWDYFNVKKENYGNIKAQLPTQFRKLNHNIIRKLANKSQNSKAIIFIGMLIGVIIACTEFLCSGQIYLAAIVTVIQTNTSDIIVGMIYLTMYSISYMIPVVCVLLLIITGKKYLDISEYFRKNLAKIKLINAILFIIFTVYMINVVL